MATQTSLHIAPSAATPAGLERAWRQVLARDASADGRFVYAVTSTGIFCRPSCPSRRPARHNVRFYPTIEAATLAGYRACLRCEPGAVHRDALIARRLVDALETNLERSVTLRELSGISGLSTFATQRLFERVMGVSPRRYQMGLRAAKLRSQLAAGRETGETITDALYSAGYSASSRLYEASSRAIGMQPTRFRDGGRGERIEMCTVPCAFGYLLVAATSRGICHVALGDSPKALETGLADRFDQADICRQAGDQASTVLQEAVSSVLSQMTEHPMALDLPLDLRATAFQERVWQFLRTIPRGQTRSYLEVAEQIGMPTASRAVAGACASNPVALVIPCHRVIGKTGELRGYRWGTARKRQLLALETHS